MESQDQPLLMPKASAHHERDENLNISHPVFKKLSKVNGFINRMSHEQLTEKLKNLGLESSGSLDSCRRRLKNFYKNETMSKVFKKPVTYQYDVICVVDFEATCERDNEKDIIQEIIEFPAVLVDMKLKQIISVFHEFVKPIVKPQLTDFCRELTGITQEAVEKAEPFPVVLNHFEKWLFEHIKEHDVKSFSLATDGPWDLCHFLARQCQLDRLPFPSYAKRWINIRKVFSSHYKTQHFCLSQMLFHLGMEFEGRKHSGYDDAMNIAKVLIRMIIDGANPVINERISWHQHDRQCWGNLKYGYVRVFFNKPNDGLNVSDSEDSITEVLSDDGDE